MTRALLVVPPFLKYSVGPLLGPSLLQAAAHRNGHHCRLLDLNALWIRSKITAARKTTHPPLDLGRPIFVGDHDKPVSLLSSIENEFFSEYILPSLKQSSTPRGDNHGFDTFHTNVDKDDNLLRRIHFGFLSHDEVETAASFLASSASSIGPWLKQQLVACTIATQASTDDGVVQHQPPDVVGVSLLHAGQLLSAVAISMIVRELWPGTLIVWGGPHISGLGREAFELDLARRSYAADIFVAGHAEQTFVDLLNQLQAASPSNNYTTTTGTTTHPSSRIPAFVQGRRMAAPLAPRFDNSDLDVLYDQPVTLPAQSTLGCAYGRCTFCTYPAVEPVPTKLDLETAVGSVVEQAVLRGNGTTMSIKDSLVTPLRLGQIASCFQQQQQQQQRAVVPWSACTKLHPKLAELEFLQQLNNHGLATLEVGLESLLPETQRRIDKIQSQELFETVVETIRNVPEISLVVNYMTGFPWEQKQQGMTKVGPAEKKLQWVRNLVERQLGERGRVEHNTFELERLSPIMKLPEKYDIDSSQLVQWPWASVIDNVRPL